MKKTLYTLNEIAKTIRRTSHQVPFRKYFLISLENKIRVFFSRFSLNSYDPSYFNEINSETILRVYEKYIGESNVGKFWSRRAKYILKRCNPKSFSNFKRDVNKLFFWIPGCDDYDYLKFYFDKVKEKDELELLRLIKEPKMGNPKCVTIEENEQITQDLIRSIDEFYSVYPHLRNKRKWNICEVGAGYGRSAFVFAKAAKILDIEALNYIIIDIPPIIFISSKYFSSIRDELSGTELEFYSGEGYVDSIIQNSNRHRVKFCLPDQLTETPENYFDAVINISSFEEMDQATIDHYFNQIDLKLCDGGIFYTKQLGENAEDVSQYTPENFKSYSYKSHWQKIVDRLTEPPFYFEAVFKNEKKNKKK